MRPPATSYTWVPNSSRYLLLRNVLTVIYILSFFSVSDFIDHDTRSKEECFRIFKDQGDAKEDKRMVQIYWYDKVC